MMQSHEVCARSRSRGPAGITIVELLVALAVMGIALLTLAATLGIANRSNRINAERVATSEARLLITQILQYHVRLAGYVGANPATRVGSLCGRSVDVPASGDRITVRYVEDRAYGATAPINTVKCSTGDEVTHVTFRAHDGFLLQNEAPVLDGVTGFEVLAYIDVNGDAIDVDEVDFETSPQELRNMVGVSMVVTLDADRPINLVIPFVNPQRAFIGTVQEEEEAEEEG